MNAQIAKDMLLWLDAANYCNGASHDLVDGSHVFYFPTITTATRAASIVTRVRLVAADVIKNDEFVVKNLRVQSTVPCRLDRSALSTWMIIVAVKNRQKTFSNRVKKMIGEL